MSTTTSSDSLQRFFDELAPTRDYWIAKNKYYYDELVKVHQWLIEKHATVLDIGCGTGTLLASISPRHGTGVDLSFEMVKIARKKHPTLHFEVMDAHHLDLNNAYDFVLLSNLVGYTEDVWQVLRELRKVSHYHTRIIITNYNYLWQPLITLAELLHLKMPDRIQNWLPQRFIEHFLSLAGFEIVKKGKYLHIPIYIPFISWVCNSILANIPLLNQLALIEYCVARPTFQSQKDPQERSVSVLVPTYQEAGNIETIIRNVPVMGKSTELLFIDLPGKDGTSEKIKDEIKQYKGPLNVRYINQKEKTGKIGAIRLGVEHAVGEIILIYDADVTIPPNDLLKFYTALVEDRADFVNGTRLVYPTERGAMRFLNHVGNWLFAVAFTWGLGQPFSDTLCGTKGFFRRDFLKFETGKTSYDEIDRYGDFYLILSSYRKNLKIAEVPVRYKTRRYGDSKMNRFRNGMRFLSHFLLFLWEYKIKRRS